jgi:hypothetical protein
MSETQFCDQSICDVYVVRQNVDIVYEIYDCDFVFESFEDFQNVCVIKNI